MRLIDGYELAEEIENLDLTVAGKSARWHDAKHSVLRIIAEQATIEAEPVRHGRWKHNDEYVLWAEKYVCSVCGRNALSDGGYRHELSNYCPNCGANMMDLEE